MVKTNKQIHEVDGTVESAQWATFFSSLGVLGPTICPTSTQISQSDFHKKNLLKKDIMRKHMKTFHSAVGRVPLTCDGLDVVLSQFELPGLICRNQPGLKCRNQPEIICRNQPGIICRNQPGLICRNPTQLRATVFCDLKSVWISVLNKFHYNSGMSRQNILTRFHHWGIELNRS